MAKNLWKRVVACLVALALVTGFVPSNTGGFWTGTGIVARADDGTVDTVYTNGYACDYSGNFVSIHGDDSDSDGIYVHTS